MGSLSSLLMKLAGPMAMRILTSLGIGTLTYVGVSEAMDGLISAMTSAWSGLPSDVLALVSLAGVPQGLGIVCGAFTARIGAWVAANAVKFVKGA